MLVADIQLLVEAMVEMVEIALRVQVEMEEMEGTALPAREAMAVTEAIVNMARVATVVMVVMGAAVLPEVGKEVLAVQGLEGMETVEKMETRNN
jgi:hypothetical protein